MSFSSARAWNDIAGHKTGGKKDLPRDLNFLELQQMDTRGSIISPVKEEHRMFRRLIQPGFSESALAAQEPIILEYADLFVASLRRRCLAGPIDLERTFVWTTFDMMGELAFGEGFGCLKQDRTHKFIRLMETSAQPLALLQGAHRFEIGRLIERVTVALPFFRKWFETQVISFDKASARFERIKTDGPNLRRDVMSLIWRDAQEDSAPISHHQAAQLANLLCLTGAETASTTLAGLAYWVLRTPHARARLVEEIRTAFPREEDITMRSIAQLPYLKACIQEGMRKHTFLSGPIPRVAPKGGDWVEGYFLPEGVSFPSLPLFQPFTFTIQPYLFFILFFFSLSLFLLLFSSFSTYPLRASPPHPPSFSLSLSLFLLRIGITPVKPYHISSNLSSFKPTYSTHQPSPSLSLPPSLPPPQ